MSRGAAPTIAFYIGILCIIIAVVTKGFGISLMDTKPISLVLVAIAWFSIAIVCYLHDIWIKVAGKIKELPKSNTPPSEQD